MHTNKQVDTYIGSLPEWQQRIYEKARYLIHEAVPEIHEEIKFTNRPYFTCKGSVCAFLAAKDHVNIFIYDPIASDPKGIINQGQGNATARAIQLHQNQVLDETAFVDLIREVASHNEQGGWRKLKALANT
jgi:hypothetical protein